MLEDWTIVCHPILANYNSLLCVAYVFEVSASEHGAQHHIYRLVKE